MTYLENLLHTKIKYEDWQGKKSLPYYISSVYEIKKASLKGIDTLFLFPKGKLLPVNSIRTHINRIQDVERLPVVVCLETLTYVQRQRLIAADIPFVAGERQVYIPFIGVLLMERYTMPLNNLKYFSPSTQLLLFYLIYKKTTKFSLAEAAEALGLSKMAISKAQRQLVQTDVFRFEQLEGKKKVLVADCDFKTVWEKCLKYMINPVKEIVYINEADVNESMLVSGDSALSVKSMLNPPRKACYATFSLKTESFNVLKYKLDLFGNKTVVVDRYQLEPYHIKLEIWKYNPIVLGNNNMVDVLSLALSYKDNNDERVEEAIEEMLNDFWEGYYGTRD